MGDAIGQALNLVTGGIMANQGKQSQMGAAGREQAMGQGLWATPLSKGGKRAKQGIWDLLTPELQAVMSGNTQVINPELTSGMYNYLTRDLTKNYQDTRRGLEQGLVNRGMDYGNIMQKSLGKADEAYREQLGDIGTKLAYQAATTNYQAQQNRYNNLLGALMGMFGQAKQQQMGMKQQGLGLLTDANSATAAAQGNYWNAIAGLLGGATGQFGAGAGQTNLTQLLGGGGSGLDASGLMALLPLFTNTPTTR